MKSQVWIGKKRLKKPLLQGGMGIGVSLSGLAGAVAKEGGAGTISAAQIGFLQPEFEQNPVLANLKAMEEELQKARKIAPDGILGFNIMVAMNHYETYVRKAVETGADFIVSGAGLPLDLPAMVSDTDIAIAPIVSSARGAALILKYWEKKYHRYPDFIVIEGPEAGGHLGFSRKQLEEKMDYDMEISEILKLVRGYEKNAGRKIPVAVGGGICDKARAEHGFMLGADLIQVASRFITTKECDADSAYKDAYLKAQKEDIVLVSSPVGMPGRAIRNPFLERVEKGEVQRPKKCFGCLKHCNPAEIPYCITEALIHAVKGDTENGLLFCGAQGFLVNQIETVQDVMEDLLEGL